VLTIVFMCRWSCWCVDGRVVVLMCWTIVLMTVCDDCVHFSWLSSCGDVLVTVLMWWRVNDCVDELNVLILLMFRDKHGVVSVFFLWKNRHAGGGVTLTPKPIITHTPPPSPPNKPPFPTGWGQVYLEDGQTTYHPTLLHTHTHLCVDVLMRWWRLRCCVDVMWCCWCVEIGVLMWCCADVDVSIDDSVDNCVSGAM
jgi:hypothetical protein